MSKLSCILLSAVLCLLSTAVAQDDGVNSRENVLQIDEFGIEEPKESNLITKCYDEETKSHYKIDSRWYPQGSCSKRICSRQRDSKIPVIKTMECEPCTNCTLPNQTCQPFRAEKNYPKCCSQCLTKSAVLKKTESTKKYKKN